VYVLLVPGYPGYQQPNGTSLVRRLGPFSLYVLASAASGKVPTSNPEMHTGTSRKSTELFTFCAYDIGALLYILNMVHLYRPRRYVSTWYRI
jgi:hypothetical protein